MTLAESILPEFDREMQLTRKLLERVPETTPDWKPHQKSTPIGRLAMHLATLPGWAGRLTDDRFDVNPPDGGAAQRPNLTFESTQALVDTFDEQVRKARETVAGMSDDELMGMWSLQNAGHTIFTMPRTAVLRTMVLNHMIHHRGQLSVYLRLNEVPLPSIYGPSADESPF